MGLFFSDSGTGPALVFLHGFTETCEIWEDFTTVLSLDFRVVAIDLPGHGRSGSYGQIHTMELIAGKVGEVIGELGIRKCLVIGHSMGGYVALAFARAYPGMLKGMVLFHSQAGADSPDARANRERMIQVVRADHTNFIHQFIPSLFAPGNTGKFATQIAMLSRRAATLSPDAIIAALEGMKQRSDQTDVLERAPFPVLFIAGKQDSRIPSALVLQQAAKPSHSEVLLLGEVGHMGFIEARNTTLQAIRSFAHRAFGSYS